MAKIQNTVDKNDFQPKLDNPLNIPNSNVYFISNSLSFPLHSNIKMLVLIIIIIIYLFLYYLIICRSQNNLPVKNVSTGNTSYNRPIQPKKTNDVKIVPAPPKKSKALHVSSSNTSLNNNVLDM